MQNIVIHINNIHIIDGVSFEKPSEILAKLFEAIPQLIPINKKRYPYNGFISKEINYKFSFRVSKLINIYYFNI